VNIKHPGRFAPLSLRAGLPLILVLAACSLQVAAPAGSASVVAMGTTPAPTARPDPSPTARVAASPTATPSQTTAGTSSYGISRTDWCLAGSNCPNPTDEQLARGKRLFEVEAGEVGCAYCHGVDGKGKAESGAPPNRGKTARDVKGTISSKEAMSFLNTMSDADIDAVAAYLQVLALP
jgi:mono/diheme cytochrome c family protein